MRLVSLHPVYGFLAILALIAIGAGVAWHESDVDIAWIGVHDCADFQTQQQAQAFYEAHKPGDPYGLDRDGSGTACDRLPSRLAGPGSP